MAAATKTGGWNTAWIILDRPKPPPVDDTDRYWTEAPPTVSDRCRYWLRQIERGWRPNKYIQRHCYQCAATWYGVHIWEMRNLIGPALDEARQADH